MELLDRDNLHFTIEDCLGGVCVNKQIFEEMAELLCSEKLIPPLYIDSTRA